MLYILRGSKGGETTVESFSATGQSMIAGAFGLAGASVPGVFFGAVRAFRAVWASILVVSIVSQHADEAWVR